MNQKEFYLRLKLKKGIGYQGMQKVMTELGNRQKINRLDIEKINLPLNLKQKVLEAFNNEEITLWVKQILNQCHVITIFDKIYPNQLKECYRSPLILFARGDLKLLTRKITVIVGSRTPTFYSRKVLRKLIPNLIKEGYVIASGLAKGVDAIAHQETLKANGKTIAVIGNGLNHFYPKQNQMLQEEIIKRGLVLSEYLPDTPPMPFRFPERNRILAGLSENVIVSEAKEKSGSLITANIALEENRNIFAVPGPIDSELSKGPNYLIAAGAQPIVNYDLNPIW
ncbi:DNA processing protein [Lactobacillus colini]|uniref:DNA processing protein n=1 Tax=Lactobacillus colini TaxID=1819254 RepID=A0ABS4ME82_9LACO|nr:DNA-processing protein DprA [Lactobacillus colini]MBP2057995.1 DNA processing protein [Lactobacillus colini]